MRFSNRHFDVNGDLIYNVIFQLKCAYIVVSFSLDLATATKTTQLKTTEILVNFAVKKICLKYADKISKQVYLTGF